jgi:hypothetical protein
VSRGIGHASPASGTGSSTHCHDPRTGSKSTRGSIDAVAPPRRSRLLVSRVSVERASLPPATDVQRIGPAAATDLQRPNRPTTQKNREPAPAIPRGFGPFRSSARALRRRSTNRGARFRFLHSCGSSAPPTRFSYGATHVLGWKRALRCAAKPRRAPRRQGRRAMLLPCRREREPGRQRRGRSQLVHLEGLGISHRDARSRGIPGGPPAATPADLCAPLVTESCGRSGARWGARLRWGR